MIYKQIKFQLIFQKKLIKSFKKFKNFSCEKDASG